MFQAKEYVKPASLEEAYRLCQKRSSVTVGGMMWLKMENVRKQTIVDLSDLGLDQIREDEKEFQIGAMVTLRMLETHEGLNKEFNGIFRECTRHIVGVQFRNGATVGGSVYGRFGFSDILTTLMALDTEVELYQGGRMPLAEFAARTPKVTERDILMYVYVKKDHRKAAYLSERRSSTDFPLLACCGAKTLWGWQFAVGARPGRAEQVSLRIKAGQIERKILGEKGVCWTAVCGISPDKNNSAAEALAEAAASAFHYGTNLTGSGAYRAYLAKVLTGRLIRQIETGEESTDR